MRRGLTVGARGAEQPLSHSEGWQQRGAARELGTRQSGGSLAAPKPPQTRIRAGSARPPFCRRSEGWAMHRGHTGLRWGWCWQSDAPRRAPSTLGCCRGDLHPSEHTLCSCARVLFPN